MAIWSWILILKISHTLSIGYKNRSKMLRFFIFSPEKPTYICTLKFIKNLKNLNMKKLMVMAAFAVFGLSNVTAQEAETTYGFEEGSIMLDGSLGFNSTNNKNTDVKTNGFSINPQVGYFLTEDFAVGVEASYNTLKRTVSGTDTSDEAAFGAGVFARYYFLDLGKRFKTYTELGVGFGSNKDKISDYKTNGFGAGLNLGINYFVTDNIAISFGLADVLSFNSNKADGGEAVTEFNANINVFNNFFETAQFGLLFKL